MELTPQTFVSFDEILKFHQKVAVRVALGGHHIGLLPEAPFNNNGVFVRNSFSIDQLQCMALLPSGNIVHVDEPMSVKIPMLYGHYYYLTIGFGDNATMFESKGVPFVRPEYSYEIHTIEEIPQNDCCPVVRFEVKEGTFSVDSNYIPPCLTVNSNAGFATYIKTFAELIEKVATHANMEDGEGKRLMMRYMFLLRGYNMNSQMHDFIMLTQEIAQAVDYYIVTPNTEHRDIPQPNPYDIQLWLEWLKGYLAGALSILDTVVLVDNSINFDELKAQIKQELYEQLNPELYKQLLADVKETLRTELSQSLEETLKRYLNETLRVELHETLTEELNEELYKKLYDALYEALYNALYVPPEEEEEYIPVI
jgi:hypothetical protein